MAFYFIMAFILTAEASPWPSLNSTIDTSLGNGAKDVALIVAIEDYIFVPDIQGAKQNGRDWYIWLTTSQKIPSSQVVLLENKQAIRESILQKSQELAKKVQPGGTFWFVFIGHGAPSRNGKQGLLLGMDVDQTTTSIYARGLEQNKLISAMKKGKGNVLAIVDACFSGATSSGTPLVENLQPLIVSKLKPNRKVTLLTAGASNQFAGPLPKGKRPAFSYLILGAFRGWGDVDEDGFVSAQEALDYSTNAIASTVMSRTQIPQAIGEQLHKNYSRARQQGPSLVHIRLGKKGTVQKKEIEKKRKNHYKRNRHRSKSPFRTARWSFDSLQA